MQIFDKMEKFAAYGFNKSHAAAYGYLAYVTAYLKANFPSEWMAALMTSDQSDLSKVAKIIRECHAMGIAILPPDLNEASQEFVATSKGIRFSLAGIKGIGEGAVVAILEERKSKGPFCSFYDFFQRIDPRKVGKKYIELLVDAGAFDFTGWSRDAMRESIEEMYAAAAKENEDKAAGVLSLFSLMGETNEKFYETPPQVGRSTPAHEILLKEKQLLGFFLTGHPMDAYKEVLKRLSCIPLRRIESMDEGIVFRTAFLVEMVKLRMSAKTHRKFAILTISDGMVQYELPIWPELFDAKKHLIAENQLLYAVLQMEGSGDEVRLNCSWLDDLTCADEQMMTSCDQAYDRAKHRVAKGAISKKSPKKQPPSPDKETPSSKMISIKVDLDKIRLSQILAMKELFSHYSGKIPVKLEFLSSDLPFANVHVDDKWGVDSSHQLMEKLLEISGILAVEETARESSI